MLPALNAAPRTRKTHRRMLAPMIVQAIIERDPTTGLLVGHLPAHPNAYSQAASMDELLANLREVISLLSEEGLIDLPDTFHLQPIGPLE